MKKTDTAAKPSIYQTVTDRIISSLKAGVIPCEKPWQKPHFTGGPFPRNFRIGKPYRGINVFLLWFSPYNSPFWLTFSQDKPTPNGARLPIHKEPRIAAGKYSSIGWHMFRHTYRSWLDETGAPMKVQHKPHFRIPLRRYGLVIE